MSRSTRRIVTVDGEDFIVVKLAQSMGPLDKLLVIDSSGENRLITVKHLVYKDAPLRMVSITIDYSSNG